MRFLNSSMFFLSTALPIVVIFYMLKIRRKDTPISSIYLWQDLLQDIQANTPWQRLKPNILMLLQLLALISLIIALALPTISGQAGDAKNITLIIDNSQSMGTTIGGLSRLDMAKSKARAIIDRAPDGARISLITFADRSRIILVNSQDLNLVKREIGNLKPEGSSTNIDSAINIGTSIASRSKDSQVYLISDGCFEKVKTALKSPVKFVRVGESDDNVAIRTATLLENLNPPHLPLLFVSVENFSSKAKSILVSIYHNNKLIDSKQLKLKKRSMDSVVFKDGLLGLEAIEVRLSCSNLLKIDDSAWVLKSERALKNISLVSNGNLFLEEGLRAVSSAKISMVGPKDWMKDKNADIFVFDGFAPRSLPNRNFLVVNPPVVKSKPSVFEASGFERAPSIESLDPNHLVLQSVDLEEIKIARVKMTHIPSWMKALASGKSTTVIAAGEDDGRRAVLLSFDLRESDLPLRIAYPILLANIIDYISPAPVGKNLSRLNLGESIVIRPLAGASSITIDYPDGSRKMLKKEEQVFQDTRAPGIYRISQQVGSKVVSEPFAVSLISQRESDIAPADHPELAFRQTSKSRPSTSSVDVDIWRWFALAALVLLMIEGWVYVKGY